MKALYWELDDKVPKYTLSESRIGNNPGLGFRPMPNNTKQGSLIWMDKKNASTIDYYINAIDTFLEGMWYSSIHNRFNLIKTKLKFNVIFVFSVFFFA